MKDKVMWYTGGTGTAGIVLSENAVGEKRAFLGVGLGFDEASDAQRIKDYGSKLTLEKAEEIVEHLKSESDGGA